MVDLARPPGVDEDIALTVETWLGPPLEILVIVVGAVILRWLLHRVVNRVVRSAADRHADRVAALPGRAGRLLADASGLAGARYVQRTQTTGAVLRSVITIVIVTVAILTIMAVLGIPLAPLLASAGIGGIALGLGAQSLVKDFLSGIFMIVEDQYGVGDFVDTSTTTGTVSGTIEDVSLRVTRVRDGGGVVWYVRNGEITRVGNRSQGWSTATVDIPVAYTEDLSRATDAIRSAIHALEEEPEWTERVLDVPSIQGVESLADGVVLVQITARCAPNEHVAVQREIRKRVKAAFDRDGIDMAPTQAGPGTAAGKQQGEQR